MKDSISPPLLGARKARRSPAMHPQSSPIRGTSAVSDISDGIGYVRHNRWTYAVKRLSVCRQFDGELFKLFETPSIAPLLFDIGNPNELQNEIELRRNILPRGVYRFGELEVLWFSTLISLVNWENTDGKTTGVPLKVFVSAVPELGINQGDIQLRIDGQDYWIAPDWQTLFAQRPENPLSAIMLSENHPFPSLGQASQTEIQQLPGENFKIRFTLPYPIVAAHSRARRKQRTHVAHLKLCVSHTESIHL